MANHIFQALSRQRIDVFRESYTMLSRELFFDEEAGRLRHSAEFGSYREKLCADFLKLYLPTNLSIGSGFLINKNDDVSTQCDLVIFDPQYTPLLEDADKQRFFPVETVVAVGEVKSTLSKKDFLSALSKLSVVKGLGRARGESPIRRTQNLLLEEPGHHYDNLVSFLICEKLSFDLADVTATVSKHYDSESVPIGDRHNLILRGCASRERIRR